MKHLAILCSIILLPFTLMGQQSEVIVEGVIVVGDNDNNQSPLPGTIRWTGTDFEGFDGFTELNHKPGFVCAFVEHIFVPKRLKQRRSFRC